MVSKIPPIDDFKHQGQKLPDEMNELPKTTQKVSKISISLFSEILLRGFSLRAIGFNVGAVATSFGRNMQVPASFKMGNYLKVIPVTVEIYREFKTLSKVKACWKAFANQILKVTASIGDLVASGIEGTKALFAMNIRKISGSSLGTLTTIGTAFVSLSMLSKAAISFYKFFVSYKLKVELDHVSTITEKIKIYRDHFEDPNFSFKIKELIGDESMQNIERLIKNEKMSEAKEILDTTYALITKAKLSQGVFSVLTLLAGVCALGLDLISAGVFSKIANSINLGISIIFSLIGSKESIAMIEKSSTSTSDKIIRYCLMATSFLLAIGSFVAASVGTGGVLPLALFIASLTIPFLSMIYENIHLHYQKKHPIESILPNPEEVQREVNHLITTLPAVSSVIMDSNKVQNSLQALQGVLNHNFERFSEEEITEVDPTTNIVDLISVDVKSFSSRELNVKKIQIIQKILKTFDEEISEIQSEIKLIEKSIEKLSKELFADTKLKKSRRQIKQNTLDENPRYKILQDKKAEIEIQKKKFLEQKIELEKLL